MTYFVSIREKGSVRIVSFQAESMAAALLIKRSLNGSSLVVVRS